jgi:hypothetical protein
MDIFPETYIADIEEMFAQRAQFLANEKAEKDAKK